MSHEDVWTLDNNYLLNFRTKTIKSWKFSLRLKTFCCKVSARLQDPLNEIVVQEEKGEARERERERERKKEREERIDEETFAVVV